MTYFITFSCYGCHLHGDQTGAVDREHCLPGSRLLKADPRRVARARELMHQAPYVMDRGRRDAVMTAVLERCSNNGWQALAVHVRSNHVHLVIAADVRPEKIMNDLKSYASRRLNELGFDEPGRKRWTRHGSTRWLWKPENVSAAVEYVVRGQGEPMAVFERGGPLPLVAGR